MTRIYYIKSSSVPKAVYQYFQKHFPFADGYTYEFYTYRGIGGKTYGCEVYKNGVYWHNATQGTMGDFVQMI